VTTRRRIVGGSLGVAAILLCAVGFATRTQADNLAVLGQASGTLLSAAHLVVLLLLPLTVISVAAALIALIRRPKDGRDAVGPQGPVPPQ
jgi:H+/Cl- antiporter ClcA